MPINAYPFTPTVKPFDRPFPSSHRLILASASPRRRELLERMGLTFTVLPADADETIPSGLSPRDAVGLLSVRKAYAVLPLLEKNTQNHVSAHKPPSQLQFEITSESYKISIWRDLR